MTKHNLLVTRLDLPGRRYWSVTIACSGKDCGKLFNGGYSLSLSLEQVIDELQEENNACYKVLPVSTDSWFLVRVGGEQ